MEDIKVTVKGYLEKLEVATISDEKWDLREQQ